MTDFDRPSAYDRADMTDTQVDPNDVVIKPPPATVYSKAGLPVTIVMNVSGVVEKLASEGASSQCRPER